MQYNISRPYVGDTDQYERWKRERGTAYADQQLRYKRQWEQGRSTPPVASRSALEHLKADKAYNAQLERVLAGLQDSAGHLRGAVESALGPEHMQRKAQALRDIADEEKLIRMEEAQFKASRPKGLQVEGLACVYGVIDSDNDRFHPGCFKDNRPSGVWYWWEHNRGEVGEVAKITALYEVTRKELPANVQARYPEATGGLVVVREYCNDATGSAAHDYLVRGEIKALSVGFRARRTTKRMENGRTIRDIYQAELDEISDLRGQGAVPGTMPLIGNEYKSLLKGRYARGE